MLPPQKKNTQMYGTLKQINHCNKRSPKNKMGNVTSIPCIQKEKIMNKNCQAFLKSSIIIGRMLTTTVRGQDNIFTTVI